MPAGTIVLTGGLTRAYPISGASHFRAAFGPLGEVSLAIP
jgi:2-keto-4-pentenoate hydratase